MPPDQLQLLNKISEMMDSKMATLTAAIKGRTDFVDLKIAEVEKDVDHINGELQKKAGRWVEKVIWSAVIGISTAAVGFVAGVALGFIPLTAIKMAVALFSNNPIT